MHTLNIMFLFLSAFKASVSKRLLTYMPLILFQGLNTLKYCIGADDDVFGVNNDMEAPILSLVG